MPRVSIIIPVYNRPILVLEAVASLQAQSLADWEAILVDDGSTDATPEVLQDLAAQDPRLTVLIGRQRGPAAARNTGAAKARSDWLLFLDSDDWLAPEALLSLLQSPERRRSRLWRRGPRVGRPRPEAFASSSSPRRLVSPPRLVKRVHDPFVPAQEFDVSRGRRFR